MSGIELIAAERKRQIEVEGFTDDITFQPNGELVDAAICYAQRPEQRLYQVSRLGHNEVMEPAGWPWHFGWWKPSANRIRELAKAGAFIAAEIDRLLAMQEQENARQ